MKAVILSAGKGTRLGEITNYLPKCMVTIKGRPLIEIQIRKLLEAGILEEDICVVCGYKSEQIIDYFSSTKIKFICNEQYDTTNMVYSLNCAFDFWGREKEIIVSYGDIIYSAEVLNNLINSGHSISICIDDGWKKYWEQRSENPLSDAETLSYVKDILINIGARPKSIEEIQGQYIGLMKFCGQGIEALKKTIHSVKCENRNDPMCSMYYNMYMTQLLQKMINDGYELRVVHINRQWFEIDSPRDICIAEREWVY